MHHTSLTIHTKGVAYDVSTAGSIKRSAVRLIALFLCTLFLAASLLSSAYILIHTNHNHDHKGPDESCTICEHMMTAESLLKQISIAVAGAAISIGGLLIAPSILKPVFLNIGFSTPVNLKVRLNN
jgi:hypothetical protein